MTGVEVVIRQAGADDRIVPLSAGRSTLGRAVSNDIVLDDIGVSRQHLALSVAADGTVVAQDLGSGNGTWLRGQRLEGATPIRLGQILLVDPFTVEVRKAAAAPRYTPRSQASQASADARLDVIEGPNLAQGSYLVPVHGLSIGRSEYRDVVVLDPAASRHHCDVVMEGESWRLKDRGSSNGVHVNEERVVDMALEHGDVIRIGNTEFRFVLLARLSAEEVEAGALASSLPAFRAQLDTPPSASPRGAISESDEQTLDPDDGPSPLDTRPISLWRRPAPWLAAAAGLTAAVLGGVAVVSIGLAAVVVLSGPRGDVALLPERAPVPPAWTLDVPDPAPSGTVDALFEQGVDAMRSGQPKVALRVFRAILVQDQGNRAAERWSFTAGEHLMIDQMQTLMEARRAERQVAETRRDELLASLPRRDAERSLRQDFRDDPVVLTRLGWMPSTVEGERSQQLDRAFSLANAGDHTGARQIFDEVARQTDNPALAQRARFGSTASRRALADQVATDWRLGVEAELRADLASARSAYRRVLAVDRANPSARARLTYLGGGPDPDAEARR